MNNSTLGSKLLENVFLERCYIRNVISETSKIQFLKKVEIISSIT